jgi:hypothetical protein
MNNSVNISYILNQNIYFSKICTSEPKIERFILCQSFYSFNNLLNELIKLQPIYMCARVWGQLQGDLVWGQHQGDLYTV